LIGSLSTPETSRKQLARVVALAQFDVDQERLVGPRHETLTRKLSEAQAALASHDDAHPDDALAALEADGPQWNAPSYERRRKDLQGQVAGQRRPARG